MKRILLGQSRLERTKNGGKLMDERKIKQKKERRETITTATTQRCSLCAYVCVAIYDDIPYDFCILDSPVAS